MSILSTFQRVSRLDDSHVVKTWNYSVSLRDIIREIDTLSRLPLHTNLAHLVDVGYKSAIFPFYAAALQDRIASNALTATEVRGFISQAAARLAALRPW